MESKKLFEKIKHFSLSNKKKVLIGMGILIILVVGAFLMLPLQGTENAEAQIVYMKVTAGDITETIDVVGSLEAVPSITLSWESGGIISDFDLEVGDEVAKDQLLFKLDDSSVSSTILQAQSNILDAEIVLENLLVANTDLNTAAQELSDLEYALIDYRADRNYWNYNGASWEAVEEMRANYYAAEQVRWEKEAAYEALLDLEADDPVRLEAYEERKAAIEQSEQYHHWLSSLLGVYYDHSVETDFIEYDQALGDVEQARNAYYRYLDQTEEIAAAEAEVQALQNTIDQARIVAPFDGTITEINAVSGELVASGTEAVRIDNLDHLMVDIYVSEIDINKVSVGQQAILTFDALPNQEYEGVVESISSAGSDESGVVEFRVSVVMKTVDDAVKPGFTTVVSIITSEEQDVILVPTQAIQTLDGEPVVMKVNDDGTTTAISVELGAVSDANTQVLSGDITVGDELMLMIADVSDTEAAGGGFGLMGGMRQITGGGGK